MPLCSFGLLAAWLFFQTWAAAEAPPEPPRTDELAVQFSVRGVLTHWLTAPAVAGNMNTFTDAPRGVREAKAGPAGGTWGYTISDGEFVELKEQVRGVRNGAVWACAKIKSSTGGARVLTAYAFGALKVFVDGKAVLSKPPAAGDRSDSAHVNIELPKGECEVAVAAGIRWGYCNFAIVVTDEKLKPIPGDLEILPLAEGRAPDAGAALARSLNLSTDNAFVAEGQPCALMLALSGGWPADTGAFRPRFLGPDGKEWGKPAAAQTPLEAAAKPWRTAFKSTEALGPEVKLTCELVTENDNAVKVLGVKPLRLFSLTGIKAEYARLSEELAKATAKNAKPLPITALALEKIAIWLDRLSTGDERPTEMLGITLVELLQTARDCMPVEAAGRDPYEGKTGYFERAYCSRIDESQQPYFAYAPSAAKEELAKPRDQAKKFPLIVFLHGYVPDYHKHRWWVEMPEFNAVFERQGTFACIPFGRSNADFVGVGEIDILDVVKEMKRLYPIDEDRVYLYGYSMGGMGVYTLGGHFSEPWAAGIVIAGRADSPLLMKTQGMASLHPFKQWIVRADHPIDLCENFVNIPMRIYHGNEDQFISPDEAKRMEKRLKEIGCDAKLTTMPGNHWFGFDLMADDEPVKWLLSHSRVKDAKVRKLKNFSPRYNGSLDFRVNHMTGALTPFDVEWTCENGELTFKRLDGPIGELFVRQPQGDQVKLPENAKDYSWAVVLGKPGKTNNPVVVHRKDWEGQDKAQDWNPSWKNPERNGLVKEATYNPFLIVYGTTGEGDAPKRVKAAAEAFAESWYDFAKGKAKVKADKDVTDEEKKTKNLFLFGEEQENKIHAEYAATKKLPFTVKDGKAVIGEKTVELKDRGLMYIFPSPFEGAQPQCSVVICTGLNYGKHLPFNHKLDLVPDFLIYTAEADTDATSTNKPVAAGFFDGKWKLNPDTTWFFEK